MFNGSNCGQKSQLSGILTEPLNPREVSIILYSFIGNGPVYVHQLMFSMIFCHFFIHTFFQHLSGFAVWMLFSLNKIREFSWNNFFLIKNRETNSKGNRHLNFYFPFSLGFLISFFELFIPWCAGFKDHIIPNIQIFLHSLR